MHAPASKIDDRGSILKSKKMFSTGKSSEKPITCRFKSSYPNEDDPELTMCVYERAGYKMDDLIISSEGGLPCAKEFLCKRQ